MWKLLLRLRDTSKLKSPTMHFAVTIYFISSFQKFTENSKTVRSSTRLSKDNGPASEKPNEKRHQITTKSRDQGRNSFKIIASLNTDAVYLVVGTMFILNGL